MDAAGVTWGRAMARLHTHPDGFSANHRAEEHFTTSIDLGDQVARVVLAEVHRVAEQHGIDQPEIVDVGAGRGRLLRQLAALGHPPELLVGVDVRPRPDLPAAVRWIQGVAPAAVPELAGVLVAHEFLDDVPVEVVRNGQVLDVTGRPVGPADPQDLAWLAQWGGEQSGRYRDEVWAELVGRVSRGCAIAVDWTQPGLVGHRRGRRVEASVDGQTDVSAGVEMRSCRQRTGGRILPQHRVIPPARDAAEAPAVAVLRERGGLGSFSWLFTECGPLGSQL